MEGGETFTKLNGSPNIMKTSEDCRYFSLSNILAKIKHENYTGYGRPISDINKRCDLKMGSVPDIILMVLGLTIRYARFGSRSGDYTPGPGIITPIWVQVGGLIVYPASHMSTGNIQHYKYHFSSSLIKMELLL